MPDCEWLISTVPPIFCASSDSAGTVGLGVGRLLRLSGTICFQNSAWAANGYRIPGIVCGYSLPNRKIAQALSCPAENTVGNWSIAALPSRTALMADGSAAERPRQA